MVCKVGGKDCSNTMPTPSKSVSSGRPLGTEATCTIPKNSGKVKIRFQLPSSTLVTFWRPLALLGPLPLSRWDRFSQTRQPIILHQGGLQKLKKELAGMLPNTAAPRGHRVWINGTITLLNHRIQVLALDQTQSHKSTARPGNFS